MSAIAALLGSWGRSNERSYARLLFIFIGKRLARLPAEKRIWQCAFEKFATTRYGVMHLVEMLGCDVLQGIGNAINAKPIIGHKALPRFAGGSAIGLSATDAYGQSLGR